MIVTINIDNCIREMPGSNYSFTSGANTGLNFSGNDDAEEPVESKSPMRMAGEVFSNQNDTSNSSVDTPKESTGSWWRNQYSDMNSSGSSNSDSDANSLENRNSTPPKDSASQSATPTYDADKYKYYVSPTNEVGAAAYGKQMGKYNDMAKMNSEGIAAGHLGLVASMMHPDWQDHNYNGTYGQINSNTDYSSPNNASYQKYEQQRKKLESVGVGQPKGKY
jgi:hypothetical protein